MRCHRRGQQGSQIAESLVVGIFILIITLALIDLIVMVMANNVNDTAAKNAARAAAAQPDFPRAVQAAHNAVQGKRQSAAFITSLVLEDIEYGKDTLSCKTKMDMKLPIPVPGVGGNFSFRAKATEPILGHQ